MWPGRELFHSGYFTVVRDDEAIVAVVRSSKSFESPVDAEAACTPMLKVLDQLGRKQHCLLLDSRNAVGKSDPVYESWFSQFRKDLVRDFPKVAVLLQSVVGEMHATRLLNQDNAMARSKTFSDPEQATAWLRAAIAQLPRTPSPRPRMQSYFD